MSSVKLDHITADKIETYINQGYNGLSTDYSSLVVLYRMYDTFKDQLSDNDARQVLYAINKINSSINEYRK